MKQQVAKTILIVIVAISVAFLMGKYSRFTWVKKDQSVVNTAIYDSLITITNRPPTIIVDTIRDTIEIAQTKIDTIFIEKTKTVLIDTVKTKGVVKDTLSTEHFTVFLNDTILADRILRSWSSEVYLENYETTIEVEKPVIKEIPNPITLNGLYIGFTYLNIIKYGHILTGDILYLNKNERIYGIQGGALYQTVDQEAHPVIGFTIKGKF